MSDQFDLSERDHDHDDDHGDAGTSRRAVLRAVGLAALTGGGGFIAACSAEGDTPAPPSPSAPTSSVPGSSAPASPAAGSSESSSLTAKKSTSSRPTKVAKPPKGPSVAISKVPVGGGVILDDPAQFVVTQPTKGKFKAFSKICTHRQCKVAEVRNGLIHCACHQSDFSIKDGSVVHDPAPEPLPEAKVKVLDGKVYVVS